MLMTMIIQVRHRCTEPGLGPLLASGSRRIHFVKYLLISDKDISSLLKAALSLFTLVFSS